MAKVLVTGGAGFIGSNLVKVLEKENHQVTVVDNFRSGSFKNLLDFKGDFIAADLRDVDWSQHGFDQVFHLASLTETFNLNQFEQTQQNIEGFRSLLKVKCDHIIYASSASVYGISEKQEKSSEKMARKPANVYAFTKQQLENLALKQSPSRVMQGFRFFNVFGPNEEAKDKSASMVYQIVHKVRNNIPFCNLFKYGEQKRDFVYVEDVISLLLKASQNEVSGVFNCGSGKATSFNDVLKIANRLLKGQTKPIYSTCPYDFFQTFTQADLLLTKKLFNWKPSFDVESGIKHMLAL